VKFPTEKLSVITTSIALTLIPEELRNTTLFITIDDTLQAKYGDKFDCYSKLFDHAKKTGSQYLNGHCFVSLVLNLPLIHKGKVRYLSLPIGYRLYSAQKNKLEIAAAMIENIMPKLKSFQVILLCDSWYSKGQIIKTVKKYNNLEIIGAVRYDTALYDLPPAPTGNLGKKVTN
jgi:hypothetical protein